MKQHSEEALLRAVVDTAVDGVILIDRSGRVLKFNPACERLFGYAADEVVGQNVKMLMPAPYRAEHDTYLSNYHTTGEKKIIGIGREVVGRRKDGSTFPMDLSVGETRQDGEPIFVGIIHDLTERKQSEQAIRESDRGFRLLVESVTDYAIYMLDRDGRVTSWNSGAQRIKQYAASEILGRHFREFYLDEERRDGKPEHDLATARIRGKYEAEAWRVRKDGSRFWANVVIDPIKSEQGELIGFAKVTRDITERKAAEQEIREGAARLEAVMDTAVDAVILIDAKARVILFNPACEKLFGYTAGEVIGRNVKMLMPEPYRNEHDGYLGNYQRTGERKIIGIGREVTGQRKDGSTFPMELSVGESKQDGESVFVGIIRDLTERQQTERAVRESAARVKAVVDTAVDGVILIDAHGYIVMFNPACERLFGYAAEAVTGRNVKMLMPDPYQAEHDGYLSNYRTTGHRKIIGIGREVIGRRQDGTTFPMDLSVGEAQQDGESVFVGIIHDLTDRKRGEEQMSRAQKMETVGQLSGGIAHDFNNLLTVILGNAEFLTDQLKARSDLQALAHSIMQAAERGAELTQRLLAFGRRQRLQPVAIDCNQMLDSMNKLLRRTLREDIDIRTVFEEHLNCAFADIAQLESAILNLALNAQDAMPRGGCLNLSTTNIVLDNQYRSTHPEVPPGQYVLISVTDDGDGMPPDVQKRVFEPFFTTKDVGKGSGLGLSQVYGFIKQSNGHVAIYSEPGLGTTVRLYLPAVAETKVASPAAAAPQEVDIVPRTRTMVLVTEDDPFVRSFAVASLESLGYGVIAAIDANEALQKISSGVEIDILFSDIVMPGSINGVELAERARTMRPNLKVLLTSGYALETLAARGHLPVDVAVLNKPYRRADLSRRLNEVLTKPA